MSTLVFRMRLGDTPREQEDLLQMRLNRHFAAAVTGRDPETLVTGLRSGPERSCYCSVHAPRIPRAWIDDAQTLVKQGLMIGIEWSGDVEEARSEHEGSLSKAEVASVLNRLEHYYHGRKRAAMKAMKESPDAFLAQNHAVDAARWKAMRNAVYKVAENLDIPMPEHED